MTVQPAVLSAEDQQGNRSADISYNSLAEDLAEEEIFFLEYENNLIIVPFYRCTGCSATCASCGTTCSVLDSSLTISKKMKISIVRIVWESMEAPKGCQERNQSKR